MNGSARRLEQAASQWGILALVCLLAGVVAVLFWFRSPPVQALPVPEILRADLILREGKLYRTNDSNPFNGRVIEHYADSILKSRSAVSNGLLQGLSEGWYPNGQKQVVEYFQAGISHGQRTKWYESGAKLSEVTVVNGKLEGTFLRWHEDGKLAEEVKLSNGVPEGLSRSYYNSGFIKAEVQLHQGEVLEQKFWPDGERSSVKSTGTAL